MRSQRGVATVEWTGLVLVVSLVLGAGVAVAPRVDGRSLGGLIAHRLTCAVTGECVGADAALVAAYGEDDAALVRRHAPGLVYERGEKSLPVDYRTCRVRACSRAPDDRDLDAHRSATGEQATAFTHVVRRGDETFIQYWLYYPYSNTTIGNPRSGVGSRRLPRAGGGTGGAAAATGAAALAGHLSPWSAFDRIRRAAGPHPEPRPRVAQIPKYWERLPFHARAVSWFLSGSTGYPGFHHDDWEGYQVRVDADGRALARSTSHGGYQYCREIACRGRWGRATGWTRVSYGSHAGHVPLRTRVGTRGGSSLDYLVRGPRVTRRPVYAGAGLRERSTTAAGLRLVPIETMRGNFVSRDDEDTDPPLPPWRKPVYRDPLSAGS